MDRAHAVLHLSFPDNVGIREWLVLRGCDLFGVIFTCFFFFFSRAGLWGGGGGGGWMSGSYCT